MDSINKSQIEDNIENLSSDAAVSKMKELVDKPEICFFCTYSGDAIYTLGQ